MISGWFGRGDATDSVSIVKHIFIELQEIARLNFGFGISAQFYNFAD